MPRRLATTYSGRIAAATPFPSGPSLTVTVSPTAPPTPRDTRGYPLPRRHLVCAAARILRSPASPSPLLDLADYLRSPASPSPLLDLADYLRFLRLTLTASEASEIIKALSRDPALALAFFRFAGSSLQGFRHDAFSYNRILALLFRTRADPTEAGMVDQAYQVFEDMKRKHCEPDAYTYTILIRMSGKAGKTSRFLSFF